MNLRILPLIALGITGSALYLYRALSYNKVTELTADPFPFGVSELNGQFSIRVPISDRDLYYDYEVLFTSLGYRYTGMTWESHITSILEMIQPDLLNHIEFDAEKNGFYAYAKTRKHQIEFVNILAPIFRDLDVLARYITSIGKNRSYS